SLGTFRWDEASGWIPVDPVGKCGTNTTSAYGVANDGTVYGLAYNSCTDYKTFGWNPTSGTKLFPSATVVNGKPANGPPNRVSGEGSTLVGGEQLWGGGRGAVAWVHGEPMQILDEKGQPVNEATALSSDGQVIGGARFKDGQANSGYGWRTELGQKGL